MLFHYSPNKKLALMSMTAINLHEVLQMSMRLAFLLGILHAMQHTISLAEAGPLRDCGCSSSGKDVCGIDGRYYTSMCQAMCEGVSGGYNNGNCETILDCEEGCLGRTTLPIKPGSPDYCWPICPFPPYPPLGYNPRRDGADVCLIYRRQCYAVCAATRLNPVHKFTKSDNFMAPCYENCCHHVGCSIHDRKK